MAQMDEIEGVGRVNPFVLGIVNEELDVYWHPRWLDWTEIDTNDFGLGIFVAHYQIKS
jgi:hypothetical protein